MAPVFSFFLPPSLRASVCEHLRVQYEIPVALAEDMLNTILSLLRNAPDARGKAVRDAATAHARLERLLDFLRGGATIKQAAHMLDMSVPRVSQILAQARAEGVDVPTRARGRPAGPSQSSAELLRLLQQGYHTREIVKILGTSLAAVQRMVKVLRTRGESVPDPFEVDAWRMRLDQATFEALAAIRKYNGYDELADMLQVPEAKQATEREELRADAKAKAKRAKALESEFPPNVVTVPSEVIREAAQKALRKESVAPTPKAPPNARHKPAVPYELRPNLLPTTTTLGERLTSAASDDPTIPAPTPAAPVRSLQDILAALNAKATPSTTPKANP